jgi:hypothetical protein
MSRSVRKRPFRNFARPLAPQEEGHRFLILPCYSDRWRDLILREIPRDYCGFWHCWQSFKPYVNIVSALIEALRYLIFARKQSHDSRLTLI